MTPSVPTPASQDPSAAAALIERERAEAERLLNYVRAGVLLLLAGAAVVYTPHLTRALRIANVAVLVPMMAWTGWQYVALHRARRAAPWLSTVNAVIDITAVTALLAGYGIAGPGDLAVKSPIWLVYFLILAARPFTSSAQRAAVASVTAVVQYAGLVVFLTHVGRLPFVNGPLLSITASGTSVMDEMSKVLLLAVAGCIATYATEWNERTLRRARQALLASEAELRALVGAMSDVIVAVDRNGRYVKIAPSAAQPPHRPPDEWLGKHLRDVLPAEQVATLLACIERALEGRRPVEIEYSLRLDGNMVWFAATLSPMTEDSVVWVARDVTARKRLEAQLAFQAFHDPLTGLANRALFRDRVEHALSATARSVDSVAVIFVDLDDFKTVNDSLGHGEGDRLLGVVATRILNATRGCDTVARLGGDEFAVLLENVRTDADAVVVADRIAASFRSPIPLDGTSVTIAASMGIARAANRENAEELLRNADVAMYTAKSAGKGRYAIFEPAMHRALVDRLGLEADLREAVERKQLRLLYQPIVRLDSGDLIGVEALVRWEHPVRGMLPPSTFIPLAEETGLIVPIGRWVIREACRQGAAWLAQRNGGEPLTVTINISGRQFQHDGLAADVARALDESGFDPRRLVLEITESVVMRDIDATIARLNELKALGVRIAIDDFGTGYSSLSWLQRFPIDVLKIDKSFVDGVVFEGNDAALARTIIALADMLSLRTVAEGIEEPRQQRRLHELGCQLGQGYLFDRPLPADQIEQRLRATAGSA